MLMRRSGTDGLFRGDGRWVGIYLVLVAGLGVVAMIDLGHTWFAARYIERDAIHVGAQADAIHQDTRQLDVLNKTDALTRRIAAEASPWREQGFAVRSDAKHIAGGVDSIDARAQTVDTQVTLINGDVRGINEALAAILTRVHGINGDASSIENRLRSVASDGATIRSGIVRANEQAAAVAGAASAIRRDLGNILVAVQVTESYAHSIDCSRVVRGPAC